MKSIKKISDKPVKDDKNKNASPGGKLQQNLTIAIFLFIGGMLLGSKAPYLSLWLMCMLSVLIGYFLRDLSKWLYSMTSK